MIHFFIGTKAQLIKTAPVMLELDRRGYPYRYIDSGQHAAFTAGLRTEFGLREPDISLASARRDVATMRAGLSWLARSFWTAAWRPGWIRSELFGGMPGVCVIHGDTASTLTGALFARRVGMPVAHLEAGLRSYNYLHPFPEELFRIWCMRLSTLLFAPDATSVSNLQKMRLRGTIVETHGNTGLDALRLQAESGMTSGATRGSYVLATCHRLETLRSRKRLAHVVGAINCAAARLPVKFVQHAPTVHALQRFGLNHSLHANVEVLPMQPYLKFIALMRDARFMLADGGSIQEECAALGVPLLILRQCSERADGIGSTAAFAGFDSTAVERFMENLDSMPRAPGLTAVSPSALVADHLVEFDERQILADRKTVLAAQRSG